jgi:hypothetical protein
MFDIGRENFHDIAKEVLGSGKGLVFVAGGSSMSPFIKHGDTIEIRSDRSLRLGDVAFLRNQEGRLVLHRVIKMTGAGIITRGDAAEGDDGFTPFGDVLGKAVKSSGYNFHLKFPLNRLITRSFIRPSKLSRHRLLLSLAKRFAALLG